MHLAANGIGNVLTFVEQRGMIMSCIEILFPFTLFLDEIKRHFNP